MTYSEFASRKACNPKENIFPKGTEATEALDILADHFLGDWCCSVPMYCTEQIITEIVGEILRRYPNPMKLLKKKKSEKKASK